ncbi:MAG: nickel pincer cofactor biosynthesis protein LarB [Desulfobacterales bacterium]|nr:nickel pincer cofactor biosynthesis protein LarB [Desulfobacterales bacterium]
MDVQSLQVLLELIQKREIDIPTALERLKKLPFENLHYARIDHHRGLRTGVPEVIFCQGKTIEQIVGIVQSISKITDNIMATRASKEVYDSIKDKVECHYYETARIVLINPKPKELKGNIVVVSAGTSDIPIAEEAAITAEILGSKVNRIFDVGVAGIHRLLNVCDELFSANVVIAVAGMEGALASVVAGLTSCPVIGLPTSMGYGTSFGGVTALLSMLNSCATGISVVNIDNGFGAGFQSHLINQLGVNRE